MTAEWVLAICAAVTLLFLWTASAVSVVVWLTRELTAFKNVILSDFNEKHKANEQSVKALEALVMRHEIYLNPEFNGAGSKQSGRHKQ